MVVLPCELEMSNRVWRDFTQPGSGLDSFTLIRVQLGDENGARLFGGTDIALMEDIFGHVEAVLKTGLTLAGRPFCFLAFSSSQLKDQSVWMVASGPKETKDIKRIAQQLHSNVNAPESIRKWMGDIFQNIKVPAKAAARMGQCFSTTQKTVAVQKTEVEVIDDVERNGYCFTDGCGQISSSMLNKALQAMRTRLRPFEAEGDVSALQIRFRGAKGVLSLNASLTGSKVLMRPSQIKFEAGESEAHHALEIVSLARPVPYYLNRLAEAGTQELCWLAPTHSPLHMILLLHNNGVQTEVFLSKQADMIGRLDAMLQSPKAAEVLLPQLGGISCLSMLRQMLKGGFSPQHEPLLRLCLLAVRTYALMELRTKARVLVPDGVCLMGTPDETGKLEEGCVFLQVREPAALGGDDAQLMVITGNVLVAKHPVTHPGDVRLMKAVDLPELRHHKHELVFSVQGQRDAPSTMSGSDLDGDLYAVHWTPDLMPTHPNHSPGNYTAGNPVEVEKVTVDNLIEHFIVHAKNDNLGVIANAWLSHADLARHEHRDIMHDQNCEKLSHLHSTAVDFPKTGIPAKLEKELVPPKVPHWFERKDKKKNYKSESPVGKMFDAVLGKQKEVAGAGEEDEIQTLLRQCSSTPVYGSLSNRQIRQPLTSELLCLLESVDGDSLLFWIPFGRKLHAAYERRMLELMNRFGVYHEGELLTGCIKKLNKFRKRKAHETRETIVAEVQASTSMVLRLFVMGLLLMRQHNQQDHSQDTNQFQQQQQQQPPAPLVLDHGPPAAAQPPLDAPLPQRPRTGAHLFDDACAAMGGPHGALSTEELRKRAGLHASARGAPNSDRDAQAAACAVYLVAYRGLAGWPWDGDCSDSDAGGSSSGSGSSSSDEGGLGALAWGRREKTAGAHRTHRAYPRLLGLPWIVAADILAPGRR